MKGSEDSFWLTGYGHLGREGLGAGQTPARGECGDESRLTVIDWKVKGNVASVVQPSLSLKEGLFFILKSNFILF